MGMSNVEVGTSSSNVEFVQNVPLAFVSFDSSMGVDGAHADLSRPHLRSQSKAPTYLVHWLEWEGAFLFSVWCMCFSVIWLGGYATTVLVSPSESKVFTR